MEGTIFAMIYKFSPSLMCMNFLDFKHQIDVLNLKADFFHIDIMDGHYVKNIALSPGLMEQIKGIIKIPMDAHLMIENPWDFLEMVAKAGAGFISPQAETISKDPFRTIKKIKELGCKAGIVLNPATTLESIRTYINLLDKVTFLTIEPGFAGQKFLIEVLEKIRQAKQWKEESGYKYMIEADGSCSKATFKVLEASGVEVFIVGYSGLFNLDNDIETAWNKMIDNFNTEVSSNNR
jgi:D-allulose-6-phosphate 3-epimerase